MSVRSTPMPILNIEKIVGENAESQNLMIAVADQLYGNPIAAMLREARKLRIQTAFNPFAYKNQARLLSQLMEQVDESIAGVDDQLSETGPWIFIQRELIESVRDVVKAVSSRRIGRSVKNALEDFKVRIKIALVITENPTRKQLDEAIMTEEFVHACLTRMIREITDVMEMRGREGHLDTRQDTLKELRRLLAVEINPSIVTRLHELTVSRDDPEGHPLDSEKQSPYDPETFEGIEDLKIGTPEYNREVGRLVEAAREQIRKEDGLCERRNIPSESRALPHIEITVR